LAGLESFRDRLSSPSGWVISLLHDDQVVVWLCGEIDLTVEPALAVVATQLPAAARELVIDSSWLTFCDLTVATFVAALPPEIAVTVRRPSRLLLDLLSVAGLESRLKLDYSVA
jgi:hypothetical protein